MLVNLVFQLSRNILKLYTHFIADGKLTISLSNPASDVCLSKVGIHTLQIYMYIYILLCTK